MKKTITIIMLLLFCVACKEGGSSNKEYVTATIDGVEYSFSDKVKLNSISDLTHIINGYNDEYSKRITLGVNLKDKETGTFDLSNKTTLVYHSDIMLGEEQIYYNWSAKEDLPNSSGTININKNTDTYLEGSFFFEGVGATKIDQSVKKITAGKFRVLKK